MASRLRDKIDKARISYEEGNPIMSDEDYDRLLHQYKLMTGREYTTVGSKGLVKLPFYMGSLNKIKQIGTEQNHISELDKWLSLYPGPYVLSDKMDGISALYYKDKLYTRGDGYYGNDISHIIPWLKLPKIPSVMAIRGEIVISKPNFQKFVQESAETKNKLKDPRSTVAGFINNRDVPVDHLTLLDFYAFSFMNLKRPLEVQIAGLIKLGFKIPSPSLVKEVSIPFLSSELEKRRKTDKYDMDGIVVAQAKSWEMPIGQNPKMSFAYKEDKTVETEVISVEWSVKKDGQIFPTVNFQTRHLVRSDISKASGKNAAFIRDNGIGPGAKILISKAGDTIPDIVKVISPVEPDFPDIPYEWDETGVRICALEYGKEQAVSRMFFFVRTIGLKGFGEKIISKMYDVGITTVTKLVTSSFEDFRAAFKSGEKIAKDLEIKLNQALEDCSLEQFVVGSGIFGSGIGVKRFEAILRKDPYFFESKTPEDVLKDIPGIGPNVESKILTNFNRFVDWIAQTPKLRRLYEDKINRLNCPPLEQNRLDEVVLFSGFRSKQLEDRIKALGGRVVSAWSGKVTLVVTNKPDSDSSKIRKAKETNTPILQMSDLERLLDELEKD